MFSDDFNQKIEVAILPKSLITLRFGDYFNQKIGMGVLPKSLTRLIFGRNFNQSIEEGVLPPSLTYLEFGRRFNQPLRLLPLSLSSGRVKVSDYFSHHPITFGSRESDLTGIPLPNPSPTPPQPLPSPSRCFVQRILESFSIT